MQADIIWGVAATNSFDWSSKNRDRILAEWQERYAK
jgi:hypothetical protein